jgi:hypothetical protein
MLQREYSSQQPSQQSQQPSQQSQQQSQEPSTLEDSYRHYFSAPNNSPNPNRSMTDEEEKAFYGYSNHPNVAPRNMTPAYAPRNTTPVYALAPASTPALTDNTPPRLWEMDKKYVTTLKNHHKDNVYFYKDDDKNTSPMIGMVWDTSINPFTPLHI